MSSTTTRGEPIPLANRMDLERRARIWEESIVDAWERRLVPPMIDAVDMPEDGSVLVAECRTGFLPLMLADKLPDEVRTVAIDSYREMLDVARTKSGDRRIFWEARSTDQLTYSAGVFSAAFCAAGILTKDDVHRVGSAMARITRSGGAVGLVVPLRDTFVEFYDLYREALAALSMDHLESRLDAFLDNLFDDSALRIDLVAAGIKEPQIHRVAFTVPFSSGKDFLLSPLVESLYLPYWLSICRRDEVREQIFYRVLESMDRYFLGIGLDMTAEAAWVVGRAP